MLLLTIMKAGAGRVSLSGAGKHCRETGAGIAGGLAVPGSRGADRSNRISIVCALDQEKAVWKLILDTQVWM